MIKYEVEVHDDGTIRWYYDDELHRENGPAVEYVDGKTIGISMMKN